MKMNLKNRIILPVVLLIDLIVGSSSITPNYLLNGKLMNNTYNEMAGIAKGKADD